MVRCNSCWGCEGKVKGGTCNGCWELEGAREKVSHVTVSGVWGEKGKGVTCNGFWGLGREGKSVHPISHMFDYDFYCSYDFKNICVQRYF